MTKRKNYTPEEQRAFVAGLTLAIEGLGLDDYNDNNRYLTFGDSGVRRFEHDLRVVVRQERKDRKQRERAEAIARITAAKDPS